ncbi:MAG: helix-turn-helix domain-containing protein [Plesiomonas sp.]|uniref:helix-turn-helix domain-containing protein n=1 Tax=Plesiomonas sp. TaxID=2486279 RepID=UPI003F396858
MSLKRSGYADKSESAQSDKERIIEQYSIIRFGERLREAMERQGLTTMALSKLSGLSETTIRKYVQGKIYPGIDSAALVAHACGVPVEWLITGKSAAENNSSFNEEANKYIGSEVKQDELNCLFKRISELDKERLLDALYNIGIKGILSRISSEHYVRDEASPALLDAQGTEAAIRSLDIRESLKDAVCSLIPGDEYTDREILRRFESHIRAASQDSSATNTPENNQNVGKKQA